MANVRIIEEVMIEKGSGWRLCFQWCEYIYGGGKENENGYRFIWRKPNSNHLQAARGQARIPSIADIRALMDAAEIEGWLGIDERENVL